MHVHLDVRLQLVMSLVHSELNQIMVAYLGLSFLCFFMAFSIAC